MTRQFPEHPWGTYWLCQRKRVGYVNVPKCASTSMKLALEPLGFERTHVDIDPITSDTTLLCVVRNPLSRFVSGTIQQSRLQCGGFELAWVESRIRDLERDADLVLDPHTQPQSDFWLPGNTIWLEASSLSRRLPQRLESLGLRGVVPVRQNFTDTEQSVKVAGMLSDTVLRRLLWTYRSDWDMWRQVVGLEWRRP